MVWGSSPQASSMTNKDIIEFHKKYMEVLSDVDKRSKMVHVTIYDGRAYRPDYEDTPSFK